MKAGISRHHAVAVAMEKLGSKLLLKLPYFPADRGLRNHKLRCGAGKTTVLDNPNENTQLPQVKEIHSNFSLALAYS